jgi:valyl-tRNA synthetase
MTLDTLLRMLAPFLPHFAEECYHQLKGRSVHRELWPRFEWRDPDAREKGDQVITFVSELRNFKHNKGIALNAPFGPVHVRTSSWHDEVGDVERTLNTRITWSRELNFREYVREINFNKKIVGQTFKNRASLFMERVRNFPDELKKNPPQSVDLGGENMPIPPGAFTAVFSYTMEGKDVDVVTFGDAIVAVERSS